VVESVAESSPRKKTAFKALDRVQIAVLRLIGDVDEWKVVSKMVTRRRNSEEWQIFSQYSEVRV